MELTAERVAADAIDASALASLLEAAGFERAVERSYAGRSSGIRRVVVRVVRFETTAGAERYLAWLRSHPSEVIGAATTVPGDRDVGPIFIHEPGGCCPKELPLAMGAWRLEREVVRVIVAGPAADGAAGAALLVRLRDLTARGS